MRERRRDYELLFIISPLRSSEEEISGTISRVHQAITAAGGAVANTDQTAPWGRRKFAYPIRDYAEGEASRRSFNEGYYVLCHFALPAARVPEVERTLKLSDAILRYLLTLVDTRSQPAAAAAPRPAEAGVGVRSSARSEPAVSVVDVADDEDEDEDVDLDDEEIEDDEE